MKILLDECVPWPMHKFLTGLREIAFYFGLAGLS
jgi:hypothetical protein